MSEPMPILEVKHLKKYFNTPRGMLHAVDDITFSIDEGKTLGVVGESGCGKSTLGRAVLGLLSATDGQILFQGKEITHTKGKERKELRRHMQIIFQDPFSSQDPRFSVFELIAEPLRIYKVHKTKRELEKHVFELMDLVGLARRLAYAFPHDLSVVKHISDDIMVMYVGFLVEKSSAEELFEHQLHPYTKGLLSAIPVPNINIEKSRIVLKGELTSPVDPKPGCRFANRCPYAEEQCHSRTPELKEVLPRHFVACHRVREINGL